MAVRDTVVKGLTVAGNDVQYRFKFGSTSTADQLSDFSKITVSFTSGAVTETYDTAQHPARVVIVSDTVLALRIGDATAIPDGSHDPTIIGDFSDGRREVLTCPTYKQVNPTKFVTC